MRTARPLRYPTTGVLVALSAERRQLETTVLVSSLMNTEILSRCWFTRFAERRMFDCPGLPAESCWEAQNDMTRDSRLGGLRESQALRATGSAVP